MVWSGLVSAGPPALDRALADHRSLQRARRHDDIPLDHRSLFALTGQRDAGGGQAGSIGTAEEQVLGGSNFFFPSEQFVKNRFNLLRGHPAVV